MDAAATITAIAVALVAVTGAFTAWNNRKIRAIVADTHAQVVTLNESTIGELAAADETRRAQEISHDERTEREQHHIDTAPEVGPPQGPTRMADRLAHVEQVGDETHDLAEQVHHAVNGGDQPKPSLYELVQGLCNSFDDVTDRLERLETSIGLPPVA